MNGFLNVYKPEGMSSAAVVGVIRRLSGEKRVGHAGTLDPAAAGVLPIMVGKATRLFDYLTDREKEYVTVAAFGAGTDTQDATGTVIRTGENYPDAGEVRAKLPLLTGEIRQVPSMYSAIKVNGKRLYAMARRGEQAEVPERIVHIERIELLREMPDHGFELRVVCGKGTYIRTLCHDLGELCGCPAHMRSLVRTRSGMFSAENAIPLDMARQLAEEGRLAERLLPLDAPLQGMHRMDAPAWLTKRVSAGAALPLEKMRGEVPEEGAPVRVYLEGIFQGIARRQQEELVWRAVLSPERTDPC